LALVVPAIAGAVRSMTVVRERVRESLRVEMLATDVADHLVRRGVPFRDSHHIAGGLVRMAEQSGRELSALTLDEMRTLHAGFTEDVLAAMDPAVSIESRAVRGGTSREATNVQLAALREALATLD